MSPAPGPPPTCPGCRRPGAAGPAPVVVTASYRQQFLLPTSLEARAVLVRPDADGGFTLWCPTRHSCADLAERTVRPAPSGQAGP